MSEEIKIPEVAESISEATVGSWHKKVGDALRAGDTLLEVDTDKVSVEVSAQRAGVLQKIIKNTGEDVTVGEVVGIIGDAQDLPAADTPAPKTESEQSELPAPDTNQEQSQPAVEEEPKSEDKTSKAPVAESDEPKADVKISPVARKFAESNGISIKNIAGTGVNGKIMRSDVELAIMEQNASETYTDLDDANKLAEPTEGDSKAATEKREKVVPMSRRRLVIAKRLLEAVQTSVMTTTYNEVDMTEIIAIRNQYRDYFSERHDVKLGFMSFFLKASALALQDCMEINAEMSEQNIIYKYYYNIGVAIASDDGVVAPVIRDVDRKSFADIEKNLKYFIRKSQAGKLEIADLVDGTFTITNGGVFGSVSSSPIINGGQAAILGLHSIKKRAVVANDQIVIRPMMNLALTYDHRFVEGASAIKFLVRVKNLIEQPALLMLDSDS